MWKPRRGLNGRGMANSMAVLLFSLVRARCERRERKSAVGSLIDQALAPSRSVAAASQGLSLHRS